ncbi:hypothetical protein N9023_03820, partial [Opitutaceae bacterium]|nr:hypothetical protein [Opitutaceae bacterium]
MTAEIALEPRRGMGKLSGMRRFIAPFVLAFALVTPSAIGQITFEFDFVDVNNGSGVGFDDAALGATRRTALAAGASLLADVFTTAAARTVKITVNASTAVDNGTLASAGASTFTSSVYNKGLPMGVIQSGSHSGQSEHGSMTWNFHETWDYDDSIASGAFDFKGVTMHELSHALGFSSYITSSGSGPFTNTAAYNYFDQFLTDSSGNKLVDSSGVYQGGDILKTSEGNSSDVYFSGANAMAANGGERVHMYSPTEYNSGSSLSH